MNGSATAGYIFLAVLTAGVLAWLLARHWYAQQQARRMWREIQTRTGVRPNRRVTR